MKEEIMDKVTDMQSKLQFRIDQDMIVGLPVDLIEVETLEMNGGLCPKCGKPWRKIEVKNQFADFYYFDPDCKCYGRCSNCESSLHREKTTGMGRGECISCGFDDDLREYLVLLAKRAEELRKRKRHKEEQSIKEYQRKYR